MKEKQQTEYIFTMDDMNSCWLDYPKERLLDILNGNYSVEDARSDLMSLIGTRWDSRIKDIESIEPTNNKPNETKL